jgi:hypothetical protein
MTMADEERTLKRAKLIELNQQFTDKKGGGQEVEVQFNPETLKVSFANQIVQPTGGDQSAGNAGRQFVGAGTTKLALQLWFDVHAMAKDPVDDVRKLTQKVIYFMTPQESEADRTKKAPPGVRFVWGSFKFDGMVDGIEESLEFFSPEGKPLRASVSLTLSQQKILVEFEDVKAPASAGRAPLNAAKQGDSVQGMAAKKGKGDWQSIAAANGIEDPLRMPPGQLIDLNAVRPARVGAASLGVGAGASVGRGLNDALGGAASGSFSIG